MTSTAIDLDKILRAAVGNANGVGASLNNAIMQALFEAQQQQQRQALSTGGTHHQQQSHTFQNQNEYQASLYHQQQQQQHQQQEQQQQQQQQQQLQQQQQQQLRGLQLQIQSMKQKQELGEQKLHQVAQGQLRMGQKTEPKLQQDSGASNLDIRKMLSQLLGSVSTDQQQNPLPSPWPQQQVNPAMDLKKVLLLAQASASNSSSLETRKDPVSQAYSHSLQSQGRHNVDLSTLLTASRAGNTDIATAENTSRRQAEHPYHPNQAQAGFGLDVNTLLAACKAGVSFDSKPETQPNAQQQEAQSSPRSGSTVQLLPACSQDDVRSLLQAAEALFRSPANTNVPTGAAQPGNPHQDAIGQLVDLLLSCQKQITSAQSSSRSCGQNVTNCDQASSHPQHGLASNFNLDTKPSPPSFSLGTKRSIANCQGNQMGDLGLQSFLLQRLEASCSGADSKPLPNVTGSVAAATPAVTALMQSSQKRGGMQAFQSPHSVLVSDTSSVSSNRAISSSGSDRSISSGPSARGQLADSSIHHGVDPSYPMADIEYPGQNDCMFGRGGGTSNHMGNINFRLLVEKYKRKYAAASKLEKPNVAEAVVRQWRSRNPPGRFLARTNPEEGSMSKWHDVGDKRAQRKCAQALREKPGRCHDESSELEPPSERFSVGGPAPKRPRTR